MRWTFFVVCLAVAGYYAATLIARRVSPRDRCAPPSGGQPRGAAGGDLGSGHEGHAAAAGGTGLGGTGWIEGPNGTVLTVVLAGYFACHTVRSLRVLFSVATQAEPAPQAIAAGNGPVAVAVAVAPRGMEQLQAACHVVMGTAMVVMFGLML